MEGEIWKPMADYENYYLVSNKGRIKSLPREIGQDAGKYLRHSSHHLNSLNCQKEIN